MIKNIIKKYPILFVLMLTVLVRVVFYLLVPAPSQIGGDALFYENIAIDILQGNGFSNASYIAPGWSVFLAGTHLIFGVSKVSTVIGQAILGALITLATYMFAEQVFSRRVAFLAGVIMAVWPISLLKMIYFSNGILLYTVLLCFGIIAFLNAISTNKISFGVLSGVLLALSALTDPVALYIPIIFIIFGLVPLFIYNKKIRFSVDKKKLLLVVVFLLTFVVTMFPWAHRNAIVFENGEAPFVSKVIEKVFIQKEHVPNLLLSLSFSKFSKMISGVGKMFLIPDRIDILDTNTDLNYKQVAKDLLLGKPTNLSTEEVRVFLMKIVLTLLHVVMVLLALWGLVLTRSKYSTKLIIAVVGYVTFAVIMYAAILSYIGIAPLSEFFLPFLPFMVTYASYVLVVKVYPFFSLLHKNYMAT